MQISNRKKIISYYLNVFLGLFYIIVGLTSIYYGMKDTFALVEETGSSSKKKKLELVDGSDSLS